MLIYENEDCGCCSVYVCIHIPTQCNSKTSADFDKAIVKSNDNHSNNSY